MSEEKQIQPSSHPITKEDVQIAFSELGGDYYLINWGEDLYNRFVGEKEPRSFYVSWMLTMEDLKDGKDRFTGKTFQKDPYAELNITSEMVFRRCWRNLPVWFLDTCITKHHSRR